MLHQYKRTALSKCYISLYIENSEYGVSACISVSPPVVQSAAHSSGTQRRRWLSLALHTWLRDSAKKVTESGSSHMAQGLSEEDGWVWLFTQDATRTQCRTGLSLTSQRDIYREGKTAHLLSYKFSISLNLGEPMSRAPELPSSVVSFATLDLAVWGRFSYRIPDSGTEGCFNDLHNSRPAKLYLRATYSAVSCLLGFLRSQFHQASETGQEFSVCLLWGSL